MNLNGFDICLLVAEGCGCIALIALIIYCVMGRRKRKIEDAETGSSYGETKVSRLDDNTFPKGIPNLGASCFMNSMLQCLMWTPCLREQLRKQIKKMHPEQRKLATTFLEVTKKKKHLRIEMEMFCKELAKGKEHLNGRSQEDSFEFYNALISGLEEEALRNIPFRPMDQTITEVEHIMRTCDVTRLLGGTFMTCYCYTACGHVEPVFQRFTSLSLPPVVTKKQHGHQVKPKKRRHEIDNESGSGQATKEPLDPKKAKRNASETTRIISNQDHVRMQAKGYGSIFLSQPTGGKQKLKHNNIPIPKPTSKPSETSADTPETSIDLSSLGEHLPNVEERDTSMKIPNQSNGKVGDWNAEEAGPKFQENASFVGPDAGEHGMKISKNSNRNGNIGSSNEGDPDLSCPKNANRHGKAVGGNTDDTNNTDENTAQLHIHNVTQHSYDQDCLFEDSLEDIKRLQTLCLEKRKKKSKNKKTGLELGLGKFTDFEKMVAADLPCRTCSKKKEKRGGVLYRQTQLVSLPNVLVLHINRFEQKGSQLYKVSDIVSYPKILDMTEFCSKSLEQLVSEDELKHGRKYSLFGVVNHQGSMRGGHYYAYVKTYPRDVQYIQNLLRDTWRDPEAMASSIRAQLEGLWNVERKFDIEDADSKNSKTRETGHDMKTKECEKDVSRSPYDDKQDPADQNRGAKETVTLDNHDDKPDIRYEGIETDGQTDPYPQRWEEEAEASSSEDKEIFSLKGEEGTVICQTIQDNAVQEGIRHFNSQDDVKDSDNQEDMIDSVRTKRPMNVVNGNNPTIPSQQKRMTDDVEEDGMTSLDENGKRKDAVRKELRNYQDRMQGQTDMTDLVHDNEYKTVALGEEVTDVYLKRKEYKDTVCKENVNDPFPEQESNKAEPGEETSDGCISKNEKKDAVRKDDINDLGLKEDIKDGIREGDVNDPGIKEKILSSFQEENVDHLSRSKEDLEPLDLSKEDLDLQGLSNEDFDHPNSSKEHKTKNGSEIVVEIDQNQINKQEHLKCFVNKKEADDIFKADNEKDPDQRQGREDAGQPSTGNDALVKKDEENITQKGMENDKGCVKTMGKKKKRKKQKQNGKDEKDRFLLQNEKQAEALDCNNAIDELNSDAEQISAHRENRREDESENLEACDMWFYISDSMVQEEEENRVFDNKDAYILLYERIN